MNIYGIPEHVSHLLSKHHFGVLATYGGDYPYTSLITIAFSHEMEPGKAFVYLAYEHQQKH